MSRRPGHGGWETAAPPESHIWRVRGRAEYIAINRIKGLCFEKWLPEAVSRLCMSTLNQSEPGLSFLFLKLQYSPLPEADLERAARTVMTSAPAPFSLAMPVREGRGRIQTRHSLPDLFEVITEALNRIFKFF